MITNKNAIVGCAAVVVACAIALTAIPVEAAAEEEFAKEVVSIEDNYTSAVVGYDFDATPYKQAGYANVKDYWEDLVNKRAESAGVAEQAIEAYAGVITDEQAQQLRECEAGMVGASSIAKYNQCLDRFNAITAECDEALGAYTAAVNAQQDTVANQVQTTSSYSGSSSYSGGSTASSDPFNFRSAGVLSDSQYRYTYYSSNVLYHYNTGAWTAGADGIYRDSNGRVVVASDSYPQGTVVNSEIFGECIVSDTGVGSSNTLDVYTNF